LQLAPGAVLGDRYRIVSLIGSGGMGTVYRADDLKLGQTVALKFLARHVTTARLLDEVRIGRQVSHPNVCRLHDVVEVDGQSFITMEFVDGLRVLRPHPAKDSVHARSRRLVLRPFRRRAHRPVARGRVRVPGFDGREAMAAAARVRMTGTT
jgi:Protein kinase domain